MESFEAIDSRSGNEELYVDNISSHTIKEEKEMSWIESTPQKTSLSSTDDYSDFESKIQHLKKFQHTKIKKLQGRAKEHFDYLAKTVATAYNTEDFQQMYELIKKYFNPDETYYPGTVGAYCGGCLVKENNNLTPKGCSAICAGSIPPPYDEVDWEYCRYAVIHAIFEKDRFNFLNLNQIEEPVDGKAIFYVEYDDMDSFPGFSWKEKSLLRENGIRSVQLIKYNPKSEEKYKYLGDVQTLKGIKTRREQESVPTNRSNTDRKTKKSTSSNWGWWLIIIIIVLLILFGLAYSYKRY